MHRILLRFIQKKWSLDQPHLPENIVFHPEENGKNLRLNK